MLAAHRTTRSVELIPQHSGPHKRMLQMQLINTAHQIQIISTDGTGLVIHAAATDSDQLCLTFERKCMGTVNHRFALSNPTLVSASSQKIVLQRQLTDCRVH